MHHIDELFRAYERPYTDELWKDVPAGGSAAVLVVPGHQVGASRLTGGSPPSAL